MSAAKRSHAPLLIFVARDLNTKFSGLRMSDLDSAALDIRGLRRALCSFIGPKTVIIGHG